MVDEISTNPAAFYKYASSFAKSPAQVGPLKASGDGHTSDQGEMAEILSAHYSSVFSTPRTPLSGDLIESIFTEDPHSQAPVLKSVTLTLDSVTKAIAALSNSASPGPDGITTMAIKMGGSLVAEALLDIFTLSLDFSQVDQSMKTAFITPIWKGGDRTLPVSYHPVALTSHFSNSWRNWSEAPLSSS